MDWTGERWVPGKSPEVVEVQHRQRYHWVEDEGLVEGKRVIDAGCGCGAGAEILATSARSILGCDNCGDAIEYARANHPYPQITYRAFDLQCPLEYPETDVVVMLETIEHLEHPNTALSCLKSALVPGGILVLSTPNRTFLSNPRHPPNSHHVTEYNYAELHALLDPHFEMIAVLGQTEENEWWPRIVVPIENAAFFVYIGRGRVPDETRCGQGA